MSATVLHLRSSIGLYGAEHMLLGLCSEQARRGTAPLLAAFAAAQDRPPELLQRAGAHGVETLALPCRGALDPGCVAALRRLLRAAIARGVRVLHCHDYKSVAYGRLASTGLALSRVATVHGWIDGGFKLRVYRDVEVRLLRGFDRVCAVSAALVDALRDGGVGAQRLRRIDNGIDGARFRADAAPPPGPRPVRLGVAARLSPEKNLGQLLLALADARARGHDLHLTIHGDGPLRSPLQALVVRLGLQEQVALPGASDALERWYPQLDAFVLPSLSEGLPLTVLEALACGCPVLASDVGAIAMVLDGLPACAVLPPGDLGALTDALCALQPRHAAVPALRRRVLERYSLAGMAEAYDEVYDEALAA